MSRTAERRPAEHEAPSTESSHRQAADHDDRSGSGRHPGAVDVFTGPDEVGVPVDVLTTMWGIFRASCLLPGPEVGTRAWLALDPDDPAREAATTRAAFCWWAAGCGLALPVPHGRLEELVEQRVGEDLRAASHAVAAAEDWTRWSWAPLRRGSRIPRREAVA